MSDHAIAQEEVKDWPAVSFVTALQLEGLLVLLRTVQDLLSLLLGWELSYNVNAGPRTIFPAVGVRQSIVMQVQLFISRFFLQILPQKAELLSYLLHHCVL